MKGPSSNVTVKGRWSYTQTQYTALSAAFSRAITPGLEQLYTVVPGAMTRPGRDVVVGRIVDEGEGVTEGDGWTGDRDGDCVVVTVCEAVHERELVVEGDAKRDSEAVGDEVTDEVGD